MSRLTVYGGGLPSGGAAGQVLTVNAAGQALWAMPPVIIPAVSGTISTSTLGYLAQTNVTVTVNRTYFTPVYLPVAMTFSAVQFFAPTGVAASTAEVGIFTFTPGGTSATLLADLGSVPTATSNALLGWTGTTGPYGPGWIGVGLKCSAAITLVFNTNTYGIDVQQAQPRSGSYVADVAGAFAASYSGLTTAVNAPYVTVTRGG